MTREGTPIFRRSKLPAQVADWPLRAWVQHRELRDELIACGMDRATASKQAAAEVRRLWEGDK